MSNSSHPPDGQKVNHSLLRFNDREVELHSTEWPLLEASISPLLNFGSSLTVLNC